MNLPESAAFCIRTLENAGHRAYAVGGCVRDALLGLTPHDYDLCTSALPEQIVAVFSQFPQVLSGMKHGTVGVILQGEVVEITTFRTEGSYEDHRHPDGVHFVSEIDTDLSRRDFTINAMAYSPTRGYADPFGGQADLASKTLRAVGDPEQRFEEDALRILRAMRFAVRFHLTIHPATQAAMEAKAPLLRYLARERVYEELCGFLPLAAVQDLTRFAPLLSQVIPELAPTIGFDQHSPHHAYDIFTHTAHVAASVPPTLPLRWAALLHDIGKVPTFTQDETGRGHFYGHAQVSAQLADTILRRLKSPTHLREEVVWLIDHHMLRLTPDKKLLRRYLSKYGRERLDNLYALQSVDMSSKGTQEHQNSNPFPEIRSMLDELYTEEGRLSLKNLAVNGNDLMALGYQGRQIGLILTSLLDKVLNEELPNERESLLNSLKTE